MGMSLPTLAVLLLCGLCSAGPAIAPALKGTGTCWAMGDPHYRSFDGHYYNFMGNCTYTMAKNCHVDQEHPAFEVETKNEKQAGSQITSVGRVTVTVYGVTIDIYSSEYGLVRVNDESWNLPINIQNGRVKLTQSGFSVVLETDFGVTVQYDWEQYLMVTVPGSLAGKVCGLCGNFNGKQEDDLTTPSGSPAKDVVALGKSWRVPDVEGDAFCQDECTGQCQNCESSFVHHLENKIFCTFLSTIMDGPFKDCSAVIDPKTINDNCQYDLCRGVGMKKYLCDTLQVYSDVCQRAGVKVHNWRGIAHCPMPECPENSHYELCGSACQATCEDPDAPSRCTASCVETCTCNQGYFRSGNKCVPKTQCGCQYQGHYVEAGASFWGDENCTKSCNCSSTGGQVDIQEKSCPLGQHCQVVDGIRGCHPMTYATCLVSGDPHYLTFDGQRYDFQGTCVYQMAGVCSKDASLEKFDVLVQNDGRNKKTGSVTKLVEVQVYGYTIVVNKEHPGFVMINGELVNIPVTLYNNKVYIYKSGWFAVIETDFGVKVSYDWNSVSFVTVPNTYTGATCGLCGNNNHNATDDLQMKDGKMAATVEELGQSWRTATIPGCVDGCKGPCPDCNITQRAQYATNKYCGVISDPTGPFRDCHSKVDPAGFLQDCVYDVCLYQGGRNMQCKTLTAYTAACQAKGATIYPWRSTQFCDAQCPANGHYELCASGCPDTCQTLSAPSGCGALCKEGCFCDKGFLLSGDQCVPPAQCGCLYKDRYYNNGQVFFPNGLCEQECTCNGTVECKQVTCGPGEKCDVKNGVRACQPIGKATCSISGDPHYNSFDNSTYDFQGTCTYIAAKACHLEGTRLTPFTVVVENEKWYTMSADPMVSVAKLLAVEVYGDILILRRSQIGMVMVNGVMTNLPLSLHDGAVQVYQDGTNDVIMTDFGLRVTYDLVYHVTVTVPGNYRSKTCGLCGNFNDNKADEFQLPDGQAAKDVKVFGAAWKVAVPGVVCEDGCSGDFCPKCVHSKKAAFEADCSIITDPQGPFATCHDEIDPASYYRNCVYDICLAEGNRSMLCHGVAAYMLDCQDVGVKIKSWRTPTFCSYSCPANSHYQVCSEACASPCPGLSDTISCPTTCTEGCACDSGFYFNGTGCVSYDQCSCYSEGRTYRIGESVMSDNCLAIHTCQSSGVVLTESTLCSIDESCQVKDGVRGCYPRQCTLKAGGAFTPFSGTGGTITAVGAYELVMVCDQAPGAEWFRVVVKMEECGKAGVNSVIALYVFFDNQMITVNSQLETWVNGKAVVLPSVMTNGISVKVSDQTLTVEKTSALQVSYSLSQEVIITVSESMADKVCGACGRMTGAKASFLLREYMSGWIAPDFPQCGV